MSSKDLIGNRLTDILSKAGCVKADLKADELIDYFCILLYLKILTEGKIAFLIPWKFWH